MAWTNEQMAELRAYRAAMDAAGEGMTDEQILGAPGIFRAWRTGEAVSMGDVREYGGAPYRCKLAHATQADWPPDIATTLWGRITKPDEWPAWTPGSWAKDAKVTHNGARWVSQIDNNTWEPGGPGVYENIWKQS